MGAYSLPCIQADTGRHFNELHRFGGWLAPEDEFLLMTSILRRRRTSQNRSSTRSQGLCRRDERKDEA